MKFATSKSVSPYERLDFAVTGILQNQVNALFYKTKSRSSRAASFKFAWCAIAN
tara:strand:- start:585 stop:746 length:162 start_codon:yes stop_codon:yes gene_type:complete